MAAESAKAMVQKVRAETARRKHIWRQMRTAGREALTAVKVLAKQQGVTSLDWMGDAESVRVYYQTGGPYSQVKVFIVHRDGRVSNDGLKDAAYKNYPDLSAKDPQAFKYAAVKQLIEELNNHRRQLREERRGQRKKT